MNSGSGLPIPNTTNYYAVNHTDFSIPSGKTCIVYGEGWADGGTRYSITFNGTFIGNPVSISTTGYVSIGYQNLQSNAYGLYYNGGGSNRYLIILGGCVLKNNGGSHIQFVLI